MSEQEEWSNKYRCRRCRTSLFSDENLYPSHKDTIECSSWYLDDTDILPWIHDLVNQSGWTTGKLYCPKCQARIGGFDFVHVIQCTCKQEIIPAIWCTKGKIDHMSKINVGDQRRNDSKNEFSMNNSLVGQQCSSEEYPERGSMFGCPLEPPQESSGGSHEESYMHTEMGQQQCSTAAFGDICQGIHDGKECSEKHSHVCGTDGSHKLAEVYKLLNKEQTFFKDQVEACHGILHGKVQKRDASTCCPGAQDCHCNLNVVHSRPAGVRSTARSVSTHFDPSFPCQSCREGQSMCLARFKIQQDLQEIRDEIFHLYNRVHDTDTDVCTGSKFKRKKKYKRVYRREGGRTLQPRGHIRNGGHDLNRASYGISKDKGSNKKSPVHDCDPIAEEDQCAVCLELLVDPQTTPCDHTFCAICLRQLNHTSEGRPTCPLCRAQITKVSFNRELHKKLTEKHPRTYRKREVEIRLQPQNRWALPSPATTRFRFENEAHNLQDGWGIRMLLQSVGVAIMITLATVMFVLFGEARNHRAFLYFRNSALFKVFKLMLIATAVCSCVAVGIMVASIVFYAFDFVKFASLVVFSYMGIMLLVVGSLSD